MRVLVSVNYFHLFFIYFYFSQRRLERDETTFDGPSTSRLQRNRRETKPTYRDVLMRPTLSFDHNSARESTGALQQNPPTSSEHSYASVRDDANEQSPTNECPRCKRVFARKDALKTHLRRQRCDRKKRKNLERYREIEGLLSKRRKETVTASERVEVSQSIEEDSPIPPESVPLFDDVSDDLQRVVRKHWSSIRTRISHGRIQSRYNIRMEDVNTMYMEDTLRRIFWDQTKRFKINMSYAFILRNKVTGEYRYFHSSNNCCGRYLEEPCLITSRDDFDQFLKDVQQRDVLEWTQKQRPGSAWVSQLVTNVTVFVNRILDHPIGTPNRSIPRHIKKNKGIITLETNKDGERYNDGLCLFRCLALHRGCSARALETWVGCLYDVYGEEIDIAHFPGVSMIDLLRFEDAFQVNVTVFQLIESRGPAGNVTWVSEVVRRSLCRYPESLNVNLHENHFSYIKDICMYCQSYRCSKCDSLWKSHTRLLRHERTCESTSKRVYPGGVFHAPQSIYQKLKGEGIVVDEERCYYPYRATYDFECYIDETDLPPSTEKLHWLARHEVLSVSVSSNIPGHRKPKCFVTNGDPAVVVGKLMEVLEAMSDEARGMLEERFRDVFEQLLQLSGEWAEHESVRDDVDGHGDEGSDDDETHERKNPYNKLIGQLHRHLEQLPVIGFNSGRYDLNVIKRYITPYNGDDDEENRSSFFVIKKNNNFMCLSTPTLKFLDMTNYLAPGFSYDKYLKAYGCAVTKGFLPYEWIDSIEKLKCTSLPPKEAFHSNLKNEDISDEDYGYCQRVWDENNMKTFEDFLIWYNNRDVVPFLEAIDKQFDFYKRRHLDMFKDGISVPGLTLKYLFETLSTKVYFTLFNETNKDLYRLLKDSVTGGVSLVFHRFHEKDVTRLRELDYGTAARTCRSIVGFDANALYLWALSQDMPTGTYTRRRADNNFRPGNVYFFGKMAMEWLEWTSAQTGHFIRHQFNGSKKRLGKRQLPVDGWCRDTRTAYQFHGCFWHGHDCVLNAGKAFNSRLNKSMRELLERTRKNTEYLRTLGNTVVEMWECQWREHKRLDRNTKQFVDALHRPLAKKWEMSEIEILNAVRNDALFGLIECDIEVPERLREYFSEMQPIYKNTDITRADIGPFMRRYAETHNIMRQPLRSLVASYFGKQILLITPLLKWYLAHGLIVTRIYQVIEYEPNACFRYFGKEVSAARREGDANPDQSIIADTNKLRIL